MNAAFEVGVFEMPQKVSECLRTCNLFGNEDTSCFCCLLSCFKFNFYIFTAVNLSKICSVVKMGLSVNKIKNSLIHVTA